jgi:hypothetical protein
MLLNSGSDSGVGDADRAEGAGSCRKTGRWSAFHIKTRLDTAAINRMRPKTKRKPNAGKNAKPRRDADEN